MEEKVNENVIKEKVVVENTPPVVEVVKPVEKKHEGFPKVIAVVLFVIILAMAGFMVWHFLTTNHEQKECEAPGDENETVVDIVEEPEDDKYVSLALDPKNALNGPKLDGGYALSLSDTLYNDVVVASVVNIPEEFSCGDDVAGKSFMAYLDINWDAIKKMYELEQLNKTGVEQHVTVGNIDASRITDVVVSGYGQASGYETVLYLMDDGTVEYIPLRKAVKDGVIRSYGKLEGVEGVVKFYKNASVSTCYGSRDIYAQRADGKYYSMAAILNDLV